MKILIKTNDHNKNINIHLPMFVITTALRFVDVSRYITDNKNISENEIVNNLFKDVQKDTLIKGLKYLRKNHKGLVLVEVNSSDGEVVKIQI